MLGRVRVQAGPWDIAAELALVGGPEVGGIGCFVGRVRAEGDLAALTLEHYPGMTERALEAIAAQAGARWALSACTIVHRIGRLPVGADIVLVLAAAVHRAAALAATQFLIDWLKTEAPLWKREERAGGGGVWVEARPGDAAARAGWG